MSAPHTFVVDNAWLEKEGACLEVRSKLVDKGVLPVTFSEDTTKNMAEAERIGALYLKGAGCIGCDIEWMVVRFGIAREHIHRDIQGVNETTGALYIKHEGLAKVMAEIAKAHSGRNP